ncbi:hypothetical protein [Nocardia sp. NPDC050406]|uniref:DUF7373 family lipoprotein n=1 Tax=Nocardia sp. NPDC050406 TaxID=3364318 RepID=UPI0037B4B78B
MFSRGIRFAALAATALALTACAAIDGTAAPGEIDVRTLDVGKYATDPLDLRYTYHHDMSGATQLSIMRLAGQVVTGPDIDPSLKYGAGMLAIGNAEKATKALADVARPVLEANRMLFGYAVTVSESAPDKAGKVVPGTGNAARVAVMQFPSPEAAAKAAAEIETADFDFAADQNQRVDLPKYADAHSHWRPGVASLGSTMARSNYVIDVHVGTKEADLTGLTELAQKVYDAQVPLLDALRPLSREDMLRLPYDPDGMLRRTLNPDGIGTPDASDQAVYGVRGYLHKATDQEYWTQRLSEAGVDRYSVTRSMSIASTLLRARDAAAAGDLAKVVLEKSYPGAADAPTAIPGAVCGETQDKANYSAKRFRCAVTYQRYVATVEGDQLADAHQRAAAQYALLANSW